MAAGSNLGFVELILKGDVWGKLRDWVCGLKILKGGERVEVDVCW